MNGYFEELKAKRSAVERLCRRLDELAELATAIGGFAYDGDVVQGGSHSNKYERLIIERADLAESARGLICEYAKMLTEAYTIAGQIMDDKRREAIMLKYIEGKEGTRGLAQRWNISEDRARHICAEAREEFNELKENIDRT